MNVRRIALLSIAMLVLLLVCGGCAAGTERFVSHQAGFWNGLWHGLICVITFIIGLFSNSVRMYEPNNVGNLYDLGFLIGAVISLGGCVGSRRRKARVRVCKEIGRSDVSSAEAEERIRRGIKKWLEESDQAEEDWGDIARKVEEKIKRELKDWADE